MFRKSLIALTAAAAVSFGMAGSAQAKTNIDIHVGLGGFGGGYGGYYGPSYGYYHEECGWQWVKYKQWNKWHTKYIIKKKKVWTCY